MKIKRSNRPASKPGEGVRSSHCDVCHKFTNWTRYVNGFTVCTSKSCKEYALAQEAV